MGISTIQLERELTEWFAARLGMTVDLDIFRGGIPDGRGEAICVMLGSERRDGTIDPKYRLQVLGKFQDRDAAAEKRDALCSAVNAIGVYGVDIGTYVVCVTRESDVSMPFRQPDGGRVVFGVSANYVVSVKNKAQSQQS